MIDDIEPCYYCGSKNFADISYMTDCGLEYDSECLDCKEEKIKRYEIIGAWIYHARNEGID